VGVQIPPGLPVNSVYSFRIPVPGQESWRGKTRADKVKKIIQFLKETKFELKRVTWPTRREMLAGASVVLVIVFIVAFFLGIVDIVLSKLIKVVLKG
jgi:preprotein translocase SecE subunit